MAYLHVHRYIYLFIYLFIALKEAQNRMLHLDVIEMFEIDFYATSSDEIKKI